MYSCLQLPCPVQQGLAGGTCLARAPGRGKGQALNVRQRRVERLDSARLSLAGHTDGQRTLLDGARRRRDPGQGQVGVVGLVAALASQHPQLLAGLGLYDSGILHPALHTAKSHQRGTEPGLALGRQAHRLARLAADQAGIVFQLPAFHLDLHQRRADLIELALLLLQCRVAFVAEGADLMGQPGQA